MALSEFEIKECEKAIDAFMERRRPPEHIRDRLDLSFRIKGQSVEIFEVRPDWRDPNRKMESSVAKATYVRTRRLWGVLWRRADLKWHRYDPDPELPTIEDVLRIVDRDDEEGPYAHEAARLLARLR